MNDREPDQIPVDWDNHVCVYEEVFEPFSLALAEPAIAALGAPQAGRVLDVGAGPGGVALRLARLGWQVTAIDASAGMVRRTKERARAAGLAIEARVMDGEQLAFADATFAAALSVFGVILFPDAVRGLTEMRRVTRSGGQVAVVTWTAPERYELIAELRASIALVGASPSMPARLPAQLRFRNEAEFRALFHAAGFASVDIETAAAKLEAPSARWLVERIAFAPGMAAMLAGLGEAKGQVLHALETRLSTRFGVGPVALGGVAFVGMASAD